MLPLLQVAMQTSIEHIGCISYIVFDDMSMCTAEGVACMLPLVSEQRREQALRYQNVFGQFCCLKSYMMLCCLLAEWSSVHSNALSQEDIEALTCPTFLYNNHNKPYLSYGPKFSISHCRHAIATAISEYPVGIDIESVRTYTPALVCKTMNTEEQALITSSSAPDVAFIRQWTRKEALLKLQGTGIDHDLRDVLTHCDDIQFYSTENTKKKYVLTIATQQSLQ